jgi:hypothetical protein
MWNLTYFKYDASYLKNETLFAKVHTAWGKPSLNGSLFESWEAAWRQISLLMKEEKIHGKQFLSTLSKR